MGTLFLSFILMMSFNVMITHAAENSVIQESKKGSVTIHKYDLTSAVLEGVDLSALGVGNKEGGSAGNTHSTGQKNTIAEQQLSDYAIQGVEFQYLRVGEVTTYSQGANIMVVYEIPDDLQSILGLQMEDVIHTEGEKKFFSAQKVNEKMIALLSLNVTDDRKNEAELIASNEQQNKSGKNLLEQYITSNQGKRFPLTDENGMTSVSNLDLGLYLIVETKVPENVTYTTNPWFVQVPMTDYVGENWIYDIDCYPKNQTGDATLEKKMRSNPDTESIITNSQENQEEYIAARTEYTYSDTVTATEGENLDVYIDSIIPHITSKATFLTEYTFVDTMAKGMEFARNTVVAIYHGKTEQIPQNTNVSNVDAGNALAVWRAGDAKPMFTENYSTDADGNHKMTIAFTEEGLKQINENYSDKYMVIYYNVSLNSSDDVVLGDRGNPNEVMLTWKRTSTDYSGVLKDSSIVYSYGMDVLKTFSDDGGDPENVQFTLKNAKDDYYLVAQKESDGRYHITGKTASENESTKFTPDANGKLYVAGMEADEYQLREVKTDLSYSLLKKDVEILIRATECSIVSNGNDVIVSTTPASAQVDGTTPTFSKDDLYVKTVLHKESGDSTNAIVNLEIKNMKGFLLPQTGGKGTAVLVFSGAFLMAGGYLLSERKKTR